MSKNGHSKQLHPIQSPRIYKTICSKGGFYISNMNVLDMPVIKTVGVSGEFHPEITIPNLPFRYFYKNSATDGTQFHILPRDYNNNSYVQT